MAFDQSTRNRLARFVGVARALLTEEFTRQLQNEYGLDPDSGEMADLSTLRHLDDARRETARLLRETLAHYVAQAGELDETGQTKARAKSTRQNALDRIVREQAFTVLNRLCALRMAEARGLLIESIAQGYQSKGFRLYAMLANAALGETGDAYRGYLFSLFDEFAVDLPVLFDRYSPQGRLFPREAALLALLAEINHADIDPLWAEDETIGWIYQYFNSKEERKAMRDASAAPRNSRELAVRNQFFTPRYVVEFLTDNTLGRIWYEMTKGDTTLKDTCRYLVRRPVEVFLAEGETEAERRPTTDDQPLATSDQPPATNEELLRQPIYIPHRPLKDPRELKMLDPACGSMHFGLYAFDLFERIYEEAWEMQSRGAWSVEREDSSPRSTPHAPRLLADYPTKAALLREVPRLIVEHNIHGIDIDPRAVQIAGLSLWLRAQRSWQAQGVRPAERPRITRSHVACAEPMPGEAAFLEEFIARQLAGTPEARAIGALLRQVFEAMTLAGEAGSLLKIEEEIADAIAAAKQTWLARDAAQQPALFPSAAKPAQLALDVSGIADADFWAQAEARLYAALQAYAEQAEDAGGGYQRRLFAEDVARGFAFIDLCRQRYDVVLMNPPFGDASLPSKPYLDETYGDTKGDVYKAFVECFQARLIPAGYLGIISSRSGFFLSQSEDWRTRVVLRLYRPIILADLGSNVLEAMVEVAAYVLRSLSIQEVLDLTLSLVPVLEEVECDRQDRFSLPKWQAARGGLKRHQAVAELENLETASFIQRCPGHITRYRPLWWAVKMVIALPKPIFPPLVCVRAIRDSAKDRILESAVGDLNNGSTFICDPGSFALIPGSPFTYLASDATRKIFANFPSLQQTHRIASGTGTLDNFRFLRLWIELPSSTSTKTWFPYAKGGAYSRYYFDQYLSVNWANDGAEMKSWIVVRYGGGHWARNIRSTELYFRPGLTWSRRANSLSFRILPSGCVFGDTGPAIFVEDDNHQQLLATNALISSTPFLALVSLQLARVELAQSFEVGHIQQTPVPNIDSLASNMLASLTRRAWLKKRTIDSTRSSSHAFTLPSLLICLGSTLKELVAAWVARVRVIEEATATIQAEIDDLAFHLYGLSPADCAALTVNLITESTADVATDTGDEEDEEASFVDAPALTEDLVAYQIGAAFGRWDMRLATGQVSAPAKPDPFDPLPICPPGQLQNAQGLPATPADVPTDYPLRISWAGILCDDEGHPEDVQARVREALRVIWGERADAIEQEACEILGVKTLREYFRKPGLFFAEHLKRYSKSRRQAPIYWPLSTPSGSYILWLYYHRLSDQILYSCVNDFVEPKLASVRNQVAGLRQKSGRSAKDEKELERLIDLETELQDFRDELLRVAAFWKPNLNDGVQITAAPLWRLFQLKPWQKKLRETWAALERGDYDWAHLAYSIWPERVREKCKTDKSLAIAHDVEHLYVASPTSAKKKAAPRKKKAVLAEADPELFDEEGDDG